MTSITTPRLPRQPIISSELPECTICFETLSSGSITTRCHHVFHETCLVQWFDQTRNTCPNCRKINPLPKYEDYCKALHNIKPMIPRITRLITFFLGGAAIYQGNNSMKQNVMEAGKSLLIPSALFFLIHNIQERTMGENLLTKFAIDAPSIITPSIVGSFLFDSIIKNPNHLMIAGSMAENLFLNLVLNDRVFRSFFKLPYRSSKKSTIKEIIQKCVTAGVDTAIQIAFYLGAKTLLRKTSKIFSQIMLRR